MENFIFDAVFSKLKSEEKMVVYIKLIIALTYLDIKEKWYSKSWIWGITEKGVKRCRSGVFIVNFEHISHLFLEFLLLTLNK